ncbi:MAG: hypothetical protein ABIE84_01785 [bacterium]
MTSVCDVSAKYDLGSATGIPQECQTSSADYLTILFSALEDSDSDQRFSAVKRLSKFRFRPTPAQKDQLVSLLSREEDRDVLYELFDLMRKLEVREALPQLIEKLETFGNDTTLLGTITLLADRLAIPFLLKAFADNPSKDVAILLMTLGKAEPYFNNYARKDLEAFAAPDEYMAYTQPEWVRVFGFDSIQVGSFVRQDPHMTNGDDTIPMPAPSQGKPFLTTMVPTPESRIKPRAEKCLKLLLETFSANHDSQIVPFVLELARATHNPIPISQLLTTLKSCARAGSFPLLTEQLQADNSKDASFLILDYFAHVLKTGRTTPEIREQIIEAITYCQQHSSQREVRAAAEKIQKLRSEFPSEEDGK